jgi:hypothetical protein
MQKLRDGDARVPVNAIQARKRKWILNVVCGCAPASRRERTKRKRFGAKGESLEKWNRGEKLDSFVEGANRTSFQLFRRGEPSKNIRAGRSRCRARKRKRKAGKRDVAIHLGAELKCNIRRGRSAGLPLAAF